VAFDALLKTLPAELVTLDKPCEALLVASETFSFALFAVWAAASVVEEAVRLWRAHLDCRKASRGKALGRIAREDLMRRGSVNGWLLRELRTILHGRAPCGCSRVAGSMPAQTFTAQT
jgi:hypothetical protein